MISKEDVLFVAEMFNITLSEKQIDFVVDNFESETKQDPSGCLPLWIENLIDQSRSHENFN